MKTKQLIYTIAIVIFAGLSTMAFAQDDYKIAEQDSLALVAFYYATDGPNWISNQDGFGVDNLTSEWQEEYKGSFNKWLDGPVKDWYGVTVEKQAIPNTDEFIYRVVKLWPVLGRRTDGQNGLKGYLPRELGMLTALRDFKINGNDGLKDTEIPDDFYQSSLQWIDIEAVYFGGDISDALRNCTDIRKMNFRYNNVNYIPSFDFLDREGTYNLSGKQWLYSTQIPLSNFEKIIDHYYSISSTPKEFEIEMRDVNNIGDEIEIVAPIGSSVDIECTAAGEKEEFITYQWIKDGLSKFGKTKRFYSISSVKASDYGDYKVKVTNDYVKSYDYNSTWGEIFTKEIHLVETPVAPVVKWAKTSYNGKSIHLRFTKPMPEVLSDVTKFSLKVGGADVEVLSSITQGRLKQDVVLQLASPIAKGQSVSLNYNGAALADQNGGLLAAFADSAVINLVREAPVFIKARTTKDGKGVVLTFDKYIDAASINTEDFIIKGKKVYAVSTGILNTGLLDENLSKEVTLFLSETLSDPAEVLTASYVKGGLSAAYGGVMESFQDQAIANELTLKVTQVSLRVEDGTKALQNVVVKGSWGLDVVALYDDGTNGDTLAGDHIWSLDFNVVDNSYNWDVYARYITQDYDTVSSVDSLTQIITQTITPKEIISDSLLSNAVVLSFDVQNDTVVGETTFGISNIDVVFNMTLTEDSAGVFLMGIDEDWGQGLLMSQQGNTNVYQYTLSGYNIGDVISYNYRNGSHWENSSIGTRMYTVVAGENVINNTFGNFTSITNTAPQKVAIYPNPLRDRLCVNGAEAGCQMQLYNLAGQLVLEQTIMTSHAQYDVSSLKEGVYLLIIRENNTEICKERILKFN